MAQLERLKEFGLNPDEWKQTYSLNEGQLYFFIGKENEYPIAGFYRATFWGSLRRRDERRGGEAFVRV